MNEKRTELGYAPAQPDPTAPEPPRKKIRPPSITSRIEALLRATAPRWWSPFEIERHIVARSVPRRLREIMEADRVGPDGRERPKHLREFDEKWVENTADGRHKVYRWKGVQSHPTLF